MAGPDFAHRTGFESIAAMGPWSFWAHEGSIGLDPDTLAGLNSGHPTERQLARARALGLAAKSQLIAAEACEPYLRRPS